VGRESILIVEDSTLSAKLARVLFSCEGFDVRTASSAHEALIILREFRPGVVLTDIHLPEVDGFELARRIRADPELRGLVVLATSADRDVDPERIACAGCDGFVPKPFDVESVRASTAGALSKKNGARPDGDARAKAAEGDSEVAVLDSIRRAMSRLGLDGSDPWLHGFLARCAADLKDLRRAAADGDTRQIAWIAHRLAGLSGMIGAARVARVCLDLERLGDAESTEGTRARLLDQLTDELEQVRAAFGALEKKEAGT
jgi:CheY-like chemotaxis protein